ncbi:MAG TPA: beta-galactosidase, partial [Prolixibacteraceae bacterium]|nr:beta-galactosidase [Prolixibacteraceae bacterium]
EDDIFWGAIERSLEQAPTYRALLNKQFSQWLKKKYGNQQELEKAWGKENIPADESLAKENIYPQPNHGLFSWEHEKAAKENRKMATHILDKMRFLYETQLEFYQRFEKAIRETGYKGTLVGSCWQAGSGIAHFYNLRTDYEVGMIDRHNYFGGGEGGHRLAEGTVKNQSMLDSPGGGLLSTGLQQVVNRPFSFSEWMSLVPNEWTAESDPIIAVYGMGLQGWDASFSFATDLPRFSRLLESERHGVYNATSPLHFGLYPALARMIYRNDIAESPVIATRNVHLPSLEEGKLGFNERVQQGYDDKNFTGIVTPEMLAIGLYPVEFTKSYQETKIPDTRDYWDQDKKLITSATGELNWNYDEGSYFTVNTKATKALVGFAKNKKINLGNWQIETENQFAVIFLTDLSKAGDLSGADKILLTVVARGRNTGMQYEYNENETVLINTGEMPLLLEPVIATISSGRLKDCEVRVLDQDGRATGKKIEVNNGTFSINSAKDKTLYYLIEF